MKIFVAKPRIVLLIASLLATVIHGNETARKISASSNSIAPKEEILHHPLPPAALAGIFHRRKRSAIAFIPQIRQIEQRLHKTAQNRLWNTRRHNAHPESNPEMEMFNRRKKDLRRLRRDLKYASRIAKGPSFYSTRTTFPTISSNDEELLEKLSFLNEAPLLPVHHPSERRWFSSQASRFAPQPKLFSNDEPRLHPQRLRIPASSMRLPHMQKVSDVVMWPPHEKRWNTIPAAGLSTVPGFKKRSIFREAARKQDKMLKPSQSQKDEFSMSNILGAEAASKENRIRRRAM